jgi:single-stranded DNA-binding protein
MIEWMITGNLGKDPVKSRDNVRSTLACNVPVNGTDETQVVWVDIETQDIGTAARLLNMHKGDGVIVRGLIRVNNYEHQGKIKNGWVLGINQLHLTYKR